MTRLVEVIAPSRLHFGMWSFGDPRQRQFGGVGAMIDRPGVRLRISPHHEWTVSGPSADRALEFAHRFLASAESSTLPGAKIEVLQAPAEHVGLGSGTQLALAVAAGLHALSDAAPLPAAELARRVGRAYRSAIGTHGFQRGGLLVEAGKLADDQVSPPAVPQFIPPDRPITF